MTGYAKLLIAFALLILLGFADASAQTSGKKPLDHTSYDKWNSIFGQKISNDGNWVLCTLKPGKGASTLRICHTVKKKVYSQPRGISARFTEDCRYVIFLVTPEKKAAKKSKTKSKTPPKNSLAILDLKTGKVTSIERVRSFALPSEASNAVAYLLEKKATPKTSDKSKPKKETKSKPPAKGKKGVKSKPAVKKKTPTNTDLVLRDLSTGSETKFTRVTSFNFHKDGKRLAYISSSEKDKDTGVYIVDTSAKKARQILGGKGKYQSLVFDDTGKKLAFLSNRDDQKSKKPQWSVCFWQTSDMTAKAVVAPKSAGMPKNSQIASSSPSFSKSGRRLFFSTVPRPHETKKSTSKTSKKPNVKVDIWHWKDPFLQPEQLVRMNFTKSRSYRAVVDLKTRKVVPLAQKTMPTVALGNEGDADVALGSSSFPYRSMSSWDYPGFRDVYLIDVRNGKKQRILTKVQSSAQLSPEANYITWWDSKNRRWMAMSLKSRRIVNLSGRLPHPVHNELHDQPAPPRPYGSAGWVKGDKAYLIYDKHDIWAVDPENVFAPVCVTDQFGRKSNLVFRYQRLDAKQRAVDPNAPMYLSAFHAGTKASGFYRDRVSGSQKPVKLILRDERLASLQKAKRAGKVILTCSTFQKYPDVWVGDANFKNMKQLTRANPQQKDYRWGSAELVQWTSLDGTRLNGILHKPEGFNPKKKYPMIVYFYERLSNRLHSYYTPATSRSSINISFYASRGYVVFLPDIPYTVGHPGQSCVNAVLPGVAHIVNQGFVEPKKIGVQGHSWGGYQIAYLVTRTNIFAAAEAGAPVSNMTSAYGGIRWSSGKSRMFQYEKTQSRIGGTLWDAQHRYIENSPIFWADRVQTPLLMLHNDKDGAVPWYQGIEMFVALRRLGKPSWMLNYNGEGHGLSKPENRRDWSIRMQQFFDHYLKGAPAPVWLSRGVPAKQKGKTLGLDE